MSTYNLHIVFADTLRFGYGEVLQSSYPLFNDVAMDDSTDIKFEDESETVKKYFNNNSSISHLWQELFGFNPTHFLYEQIKPFLENKSAGELDLLLVNKNTTNSVQIEFKRFIDKKEETIFVDKVKLSKLVKQCNRNYSMGFHKVYAGLIINVQGFKQNSPNIFHRDISDEDLKKINDFLNQEGLNPNVGILVFQIVWTSGKHINDQNGIGIGVYKEAVSQEQKADISEKIEMFIKR